MEMPSTHWKIVYENFTYYVELYLDEPSPLGNAYPSLLINGVKRDAELSGDQKTLRAAISISELDSIQEVTTPLLFLRSLRGRWSADKKSRRKKTVDRSPGVRVANSLSRGAFAVVRHNYDYGDQALPLPGAPSNAELRAAVYMPDAQAGAHPVVVFLHGRHDPCYRDDQVEPGPWPCNVDFGPLPNHEGYGEAATALASQGYVVVSLSANALFVMDDGSNRRGHLILAHLDLLAAGNDGSRPELSFLAGRLDLDRIGLMGHSRGGEGIARAITLNRLLDKGYGIQAAVLLASTAQERIAIANTHTAAILPFLDGDVIELDGQRMTDLSRYAFDDNVLRSSVVMLGANHNFFNSIWSPGFPGGFDDTGASWGEVELARLGAEQQELLGAFYIAGFFRLALGGEQVFLALFDGSRVTIPVLPQAEMRSSAYFPASSCYRVQSFETFYADEHSGFYGNWAWRIRQGVGEIKNKASFGNDLRYSHSEYHSYLNLRGERASSAAQLELYPREGEAPVDISPYSHLSFQVALLQNENPEQTVELSLSLGEATLDLTQQLLALRPLPEIIPGVATFLQQQISIPLTDFPVDVSRPVDTLLFTLPRGGSIYLSDIVFVKPSLGDIRPDNLPFVSLMEDTPVFATGAAQELEISVTLSRASAVRVSMRVCFDILHRVQGVMSFDEPLVFEPAELAKSVRVLIPPGGFRTGFGNSAEGYYRCDIYLRALANGLFARNQTRLLITPFP